MNNDLQSAGFRERWAHIAEPGWEVNQEVFNRADRRRTKVLHCAIPMTQAKRLTDATFPAGWDADKCFIASVGRKTLPELANWEYTPQIRAVPHLPCFKALPTEHGSLSLVPEPVAGDRHLRYHRQLWNELRPKTLRGVHTTLVYVTPQLGYSLTPHIKSDKALHCFGALSRCAGPVQLFPAKYLYPDAALGPWQRAPAPIFADHFPYVGGSNFPLIDRTPDPWGKIARFEGPDYFYGYPFNAITNPVEDATIQQRILAAPSFPTGGSRRRVRPRPTRMRPWMRN